MRTTLRAAVMIAAAVPAFAFAPGASAQSMAGVWETQVPTRMSIQNGEQSGTNFATLTFTIEVRGDSAFATVQRGHAEGVTDVPARRMKGTIKDGVATFVGEPQEAKRSINGEESTVTMTTAYTLKLDGDALVGQQITTSSDENMAVTPRDVKFTRKR